MRYWRCFSWYTSTSSMKMVCHTGNQINVYIKNSKMVFHNIDAGQSGMQ